MPRKRETSPWHASPPFGEGLLPESGTKCPFLPRSFRASTPSAWLAFRVDDGIVDVTCLSRHAQVGAELRKP